MKKALIYLSICITLLAFNSNLFAQKSGKFYAFASKRKVKRAKVKYNTQKDVVEVKLAGVNYVFKRERVKNLKEKVYSAANKRMFYLEDDGSWIITGNLRTNPSCKIKYSEKSYSFGIAYLSTDKAKVSSMNKEKGVKIVEEAYAKLCQAYRVIEEAKIAKVPLPEEGMKNAKLLPEAIKVSKRWIAGKRWKEKIIGGYFFSKEWNTIRHKRSGRVLGRRVRLIGLMKMPDGRCKFGHFFIRQNFNGTKYGVTFCEANSRVFEVSCDKVQAKIGK
ncbi:hypothetical protein [Microscilla marina]|uniref:Uncharacterized protein n=1 Tax=Microscilla marina ATCC 23134 TaxID=313606 RepID=A1ZJ66_MICM2|nr:hypothetical protein [Microscilla marina]EAY29602.1 hypothetical protein M23134_00486 [Microscilla marina ATCC 23134]